MAELVARQNENAGREADAVSVRVGAIRQYENRVITDSGLGVLGAPVASSHVVPPLDALALGASEHDHPADSRHKSRDMRPERHAALCRARD
jgi:hypothetical protein